MISTKYFDQRGKDVLAALQTGKKPTGVSSRSATLPAVTQAVLSRWMQSVYVCRDAEPTGC
jgi:hypothetical protein